MRDWRGPIAFVLALGVAITLVAGDITAEITPGKVTTEEVSFLSTLAGAIVGAVATYLGVRHIDNDDHKESKMETREAPVREPLEPTPTDPPYPGEHPPQPGQPIPEPGQPIPEPGQPYPAEQPGGPPDEQEP